MKKWTAEETARMLEMWEAGKSYSQIAAAFGSTRNAISGLMVRNRDIFSKRPRKEQPKRLDFKAREQGVERIDIEAPPKTIPLPKGAKFKPWIDLERNECQWGLEDGEEHFFDEPSNKFACCGLKISPEGVAKGQRFCDYHMRFAYKKG